MLSTAQSLRAWRLAMLMFTLGVIRVIPAEYMFINSIATEHLRSVSCLPKRRRAWNNCTHWPEPALRRSATATMVGADEVPPACQTD